MPEETGTLYVIATPIGNLADVTLRALDVLRRVDLVAAEDTRRTRKLLSHYDIHQPLISYHSNNAHTRGPELLAKLAAGKSIALVTDAGTPGISDPGSLLIHGAIEQHRQVVVVPGPSAVISALAVSGLATHPFAFLGFPPPRGAQRERFWTAHAQLPMTLVLFESPVRLGRTLADLLSAWGNRRMALARELTKRFEQVFRGTVEEAIEAFREPVKGEITLVVAGADRSQRAPADDRDWRERLREMIEDQRMSVKDAVRELRKESGMGKKDLYREALKIRAELDG